MSNFGNVKSASVGTSAVNLKVVTTPTLVTGCNILNKSGSTASISLYVTNTSVDYYIFKNKQIDGNTNIEAITGNKIVLVNGDTLKAISDVSAAFDIIVSTLDGF
jgi:hypothetical protein